MTLMLHCTNNFYETALRFLKLTHRCSFLVILLELGGRPTQACPLEFLKAPSLFCLAGLLKDAVPAMKAGTNADLQVHSLLLHSGLNLEKERAAPT